MNFSVDPRLVVDSAPPKTKIESARRRGSIGLGFITGAAASTVAGARISAPKLCEAGKQANETKVANVKSRTVTPTKHQR